MFYIVFYYNRYLGGTFGPTKYIIGIYKTNEEAIQRQKEFCTTERGGWKKGVNSSIVYQDIVTFVNKIPEGDDVFVALFTT